MKPNAEHMDEQTTDTKQWQKLTWSVELKMEDCVCKYLKCM